MKNYRQYGAHIIFQSRFIAQFVKLVEVVVSALVSYLIYIQTNSQVGKLYLGDRQNVLLPLYQMLHAKKPLYHQNSIFYWWGFQ